MSRWWTGAAALVPALVVVLSIGCAPSYPALSQPASRATIDLAAPPLVGPSAGTLVVAGGGDLGPDIWSRFLQLAGGPEARIVVIPTAGADEAYPDDWSGLDDLRAAGATNITVLHTRDRLEANTVEFTEPLREATGVWFPGGRQWRLVDAYLNTLLHRELFYLLERDGVVGGTSAGASIQASFLLRGDPETNQVLFSPEYEVGFGLLNQTAVDQHLLARQRQEDLWELLRDRTDLLGIGIDEGTALVIQGDRAEVIGSSSVLIYDPRGAIRQARKLDPGDVFHLGARAFLGRTVVDQASEHP